VNAAPGFKDHFSGHSGDYARARPVYPESLFAYLATLPRGREAVWDCGTGTGQAAHSLAAHFRRVIATDASANQASRAAAAKGVLYAAAPAERAPLRDASMDLITVAQALHWFDFPAFFAEAARVAKPGGAFAAWCYGNCKVTPEIDRAYYRLYEDIVGSYWPPERAHVENGYASIPMPFAPIAAPAFAIEARWDMEEFIAYLETWSAVQYYRKAGRGDPVALIREELAGAWGNPGEARLIRWPLAFKAGRVGA
jgi:SAM-dependent methyltransferase